MGDLKEDALALLNEFYSLNSTSFEDFGSKWKKHIRSIQKLELFDIFLQYIAPQNDSLLMYLTISLGLYFTFYSTQEMVLISVTCGQYEILLKTALEFQSLKWEDGLFCLSRLFKEDAFCIVPQPLHCYDVEFDKESEDEWQIDDSLLEDGMVEYEEMMEELGREMVKVVAFDPPSLNSPWTE